MNWSFKKAVLSLVSTGAILLLSAGAFALLPTHDCGFCHSLHGSDTGFVPRSDPVNLEVLCMGCHLTANGSTDAVQPHRGDNANSYAKHYVTCTDCHEVHDNMPNWRANDPNHATHDNSLGRDGTDIPLDGWPVGVNTKMVGREDPDGETPYAIIITREADFNKDGIPDRKTVPAQVCDPLVINDCYVAGKRHVIFENLDPPAKTKIVHGWADYNVDGMQPSDATAWGETIPDWSDTTPPEGAPHDAICQMCHSQTSNNSCGFNWSPERNCSLHNQDRQCTDCHQHDQCFDNNGTCDIAWVLPNRDVRMDTVSAAPVSVTSGQTVTITADFTNLGDATEVVRVKFYSSVDGYLGLTDVSGVAPAGTGQAFFGWITTTVGSHVVSAEAQPVLGEINVANNLATGNTVTVN